MQNAIAFADNDVVVVAWSWGRRLAGCLGFAVYRIDAAGTETALPSMAVFPGFQRKPGQTTARFPVQKFYWKDPYARLVARKTGEARFRYKVVPLHGKPGALKPMPVGYAVSNEVEVTPRLSSRLSATFNRGLISTQHVSAALGPGRPGKARLLDRVADLQDRLRSDLAGDMIAALTGFLAEVGPKDRLYAALYELGDPQLVPALAALGPRAHVILSNPKASDRQSSNGITDGNAESRQALVAAGVHVVDRLLPGNQIGHNKFAVLVKDGKATAVLMGSTNWTATGLCTQTNNTLVWHDPPLARRYLACWRQLAADTAAAQGDPKALQGATLRAWDAKPKTLRLEGGVTVTSWFSPNTPSLRKSRTSGETRPPDMEDLATRMLAARDAILFLAFYPGSPSLANWAAQAQKANPALFVRGCVTHPSAAEGFVYDLQGAAGKGRQDPRVISARALDRVVPEGWREEILNAGFAVTHDKIVVIDPFSDRCVVATGSHNLGHKASFNNDENLVIVQGDRRLAQAYATHVLDVYDHFSWRWMVQNGSAAAADTSLKTDPDAWQSRYYAADGSIRNAQLRFWLSAQAA